MNAIFLNIVNLVSPSTFNWIQFIFLAGVIIGAGYLYRYSHVSSERLKTLLIRLIIATIGFRIVFAGIKMGIQYYMWANDALSKLLLPPTQSIAVFLRYSWTHFWINALLSVGVGLFMFVVLRALQKKNERFFDDGEVELGALLSVVVGWPHFAIFFPLVFIFVVLFSIVRGVAYKEPFTTLGLPLIGAATVALVFALQLLTLLHMNALVI